MFIDDGVCEGLEEDEKGNLRTTIAYNVKCETKAEGGLTILAKFPVRGTTYTWGLESHNYLRLRNRTVSLGREPGNYVVRLNYDSTFESANPLDWTPDVEWDATAEEVALFRDRSSSKKLIRNSAGDPPDPPLLGPEAILVCRVQRNELTYNKLTAFNFFHKINDKPWNGFPKHTVKCLRIPGRTQKAMINGVTVRYASVSYEFAIKSQKDKDGNEVGWNYLCDDEGFNKLTNTDNGYKKEAILLSGKMATVPQGLDGNGQPVAVGANPAQLQFQLNYETDFDLLNLVI